MKQIAAFALVLGTLIGCNAENGEMKELTDERNEELSTDNQEVLEQGQKIALQTQGVLGKNLVQAINTNGTEYALSFCNVRAIPLTDSMSVVQNAQIRRVSDKNRNPQNKANERELEYIMKMKEAMANGAMTEPKLVSNGDSHIGYYPILTNNMCLQCHGKVGTDITKEVSNKIKALYPSDLATGYGPNELRGIWVVEW